MPHELRVAQHTVQPHEPPPELPGEGSLFLILHFDIFKPVHLCILGGPYKGH